MSRSLMISNFILFQLGWFACVLGGANQLALAGSVVAVTIIVIHVWRADAPLAEIYLLLVALLIGVVFESLLTFSQLTQYSTGVIVEGIAPYWMVLMWGLFATTLNVSMRWVKALSLPVVGLLGMVLAPLSYLAGNRLGAVTFSDTTTALLLIAGGWAVLFPLLVYVAQKHNGYVSAESVTENAESVTENNDRSFANV